MDSWGLDKEPIVQQVSQPNDSLRRRAIRLQNHVDGEVEDEDGDSANGFILADPVPSPYIRSLFQTPPRSNSKKHKRDESEAEEDFHSCSSSSNSGGWFSCNLCKSTFSLEDLSPPVSTCSCLICRSCMKSYVTSTLAELMSHPKRSRIDDEHDHEEDGDHDEHDHMEGASSSSQDFISCPTPFCPGRFCFTDVQAVAPECFTEWEAAASEALVENSGEFVRCPVCYVVIEKVASVLPPGLALSGVPEVDRTCPFTELDDEGRPLSRRAMLDKAVNRFRCSMCSGDFCAACRQFPYHLGKTCEEVEQEKQAFRCVYCDEVFRHRLKTLQEEEEVSISVKDLRGELELQGADSSWCVEKKDLVSVKLLCNQVCEKKDCRARLREACTRSLHCGHRCLGVRGELQCLPCLEQGCRGSSGALPSCDECCSICFVDPIRAAPSLQLTCGHIVHSHCVKRQLQEGYPGPEISCGYLHCPQCKTLMQHQHLTPYLHKHLAMMEEIRDKAFKRLRHDMLTKGESFDENQKPEAQTLERYQYYMCSKCNSPYFGGMRNCGANLQEERRRFDPRELVCGGCSLMGSEKGKCKRGHGNEYIEFKCRFCCSIATFFCFGTHHFCDGCHQVWPKLPNPLPRCEGVGRCPLGMNHSPNGNEFCLGCSMCRSQEQI